jgi:hypothetical protein
MNQNKKKKKFSFPVTTLAGSLPLNFIRVCRKHKIENKYYFKTVLSFLASLVLGLFAFWELIRWSRKIRKTEPKEPPVFIIGFWRSGTTLLHNLLCQDPNASYVTTFQTVFPHLVLSHNWLKMIADWLLPEERPFDNYNWSMDSPQEEEFALTSLQSNSYYNFYLFPNDYDEIYKNEFYTENLSPVHKQIWKRQYRKLIQKAIVNIGGERYIGKNPCSLARISVLREMYPDAKFIFIYRNPYKVVESLYGFIYSIFPGVQLQTPAGIPDRDRIVSLYCETLRHYFKVRSEIDSSNLIEFAYEDMCRDIPGTIREIYSKLQLRGFEHALPRITSYLNDNGSNDRKPLVIPSETYRLLNQRAPDIFHELGYQMEEK